jgi:archaellum component FlaF (FlaF/FlaG flagellin family)
MTILIICIIVDLVCIMYLYSPTNENNNDIIKNINTNKKEKTKKKNKKEKNKKNKTNKTKLNNTIKTFNEDVLTNIETYETIS